MNVVRYYLLLIRYYVGSVSPFCRASRCVKTLGIALLLFCCLPSLQSSSLYAQEQATEETVYRVETAQGEVVIGILVSETEQELTLNTEQLGQVTLKRANIRRMEEIDPESYREGEYWHRNPQSTRYLFAPNAIGLPQGEGYYQNTWILLNNLNYGISNRFSVGAGTVPVFLFGANVFPIWVLPKLSISVPQENLHFAGGAVLGGVLGSGGGSVGLVYGSSTIGSRDHNATLGVGYGYTGGRFSDVPAINISGMTRIGRTIYLISENYFFPAVDEANLVSLGIRWAPENFAADFALVRPLSAETGSFIAVPWLGVTIPFGR